MPRLLLLIFQFSTLGVACYHQVCFQFTRRGVVAEDVRWEILEEANLEPDHLLPISGHCLHSVKTVLRDVAKPVLSVLGESAFIWMSFPMVSMPKVPICRLYKLVSIAVSDLAATPCGGKATR